MISYQKRFVFLKTRKTAGTSFEMMLEPWCAPPGHVVTEAAPELVTRYGIVGARLNRRKETPYWRNHIGAKKVAEHLGDAFWTDYLRLTSVRNPFSRSISQFYWQRVWQNLAVPQTFEETREQFRAYIFSNMFTSDSHVAHVGDRFCIDDAFRLEHLDEDFRRIGGKLGIKLRREDMPRTKDNSSTKPDLPFIDLFEPDVVAEICIKQRWVFEHFGYSTDPRDAKL